MRVGVQPTFARYTFPLPALISVSADRTDDQMTFKFEAPIKVDLADAQAALPPTISAIDTQTGAGSVTVRFDFIGKVDVRTFREDNNYVVDVLPIGTRGERAPEKPEPAAPRAETSPPQRPINSKPPETKSATQKITAGKTTEPKAPEAKIAEAKAPEAKASAAKIPEVSAPEVRATETRKPDLKTAEPKGPEPKGPEPKSPEAGPAETGRAPEPASDKPTVSKPDVVASKPAEAPPQVTGPPARVPSRDAQESNAPDPALAAAPVVVDVRRQGEALRLTFPFTVPTPAAVFRRADTIWLVFDSQAPIDINKITAQSGRSILNASVTRSRQGQVIQLKLDKPKLTSVGADGIDLERGGR